MENQTIFSKEATIFIGFLMLLDIYGLNQGKHLGMNLNNPKSSH